MKSQNITPRDLEDSDKKIFVIANFFLLQEAVKYALEDKTYIILEHDHKYVASNNPSLYPDFLAPEEQIINKRFYTNALAVLCQSKKHSEILQKNLLINNIVNLGGNLWTEEQLSVLEQNIDTPQKTDFAVIRTNNKNKGMPAAIDFCNKQGIDFQFIESQPFESFISTLASVKHLVFFPQWFETYNRLSIEARVVGCKLVTNSLIGAASEEHFKLKGRELLDFLRENNTTLIKKWKVILSEQEIAFIPPVELPKVTIFCPLYAGEKYIKGFLEDIENQTIFEDCELIIINANSPENEEEIILDFMKSNNNVVYRKLDYRATVMETENMAIEMATGDFFAQACVDDRHSATYLETMAKHLHYSKGVDLVYADCFQTTAPNETFEKNSSNGTLYEHSKNAFSRENMIKCLPGPMPMWKKSIHKTAGLFNDSLSYAGDWEMFLRMVEVGSVFKKIKRPLGLYFYNDDGLSTSKEHSKPRQKEEAEVFFNFKDIFGQKNFEAYKSYFQHLRGEENE